MLQSRNINLFLLLLSLSLSLSAEESPVIQISKDVYEKIQILAKIHLWMFDEDIKQSV
jgi:hypothetical protein